MSYNKLLNTCKNIQNITEKIIKLINEYNEKLNNNIILNEHSESILNEKKLQDKKLNELIKKYENLKSKHNKLRLHKQETKTFTELEENFYQEFHYDEDKAEIEYQTSAENYKNIIKVLKEERDKSLEINSKYESVVLEDIKREDDLKDLEEKINLEKLNYSKNIQETLK